MRLAFLLLGFAGLTALGATAHAQAPRAVVALAAGPSAVGAGGFGDAWRADTGVAARGEVSAYGGVARGALVALPFDAADGAAVPGFLLVGATAGWGARVALPVGAELVVGPTVGVLAFRFRDAEAFPGFQGNETETAVGAFAGVRVPVARRVVVWADAEALRVALAPSRGLLTVAGGVALRLDVPDALARALR